MKYPLYGRRVAIERDVQTLRFQELTSYVLKSLLLVWHVLYVLKLVLTRCGMLQTKHGHPTDGAVAYKLWSYPVAVN